MEQRSGNGGFSPLSVTEGLQLGLRPRLGILNEPIVDRFSVKVLEPSMA